MGKNAKYENAAELYEKYAAQNTGKEGYKNSLNMASDAAKSVANDIQSQVQSSARNAGLGKSASAMVGQNAVSNAYSNNLLSQQNMATSQLGNQLNAQGNLMASQQAEGNNIHKRAWDNAANALNMVGTGVKTFTNILSDERLKKYKDISSKYNSDNIASDERLKNYYDITKEWK